MNNVPFFCFFFVYVICDAVASDIDMPVLRMSNRKHVTETPPCFKSMENNLMYSTCLRWTSPNLLPFYLLYKTMISRTLRAWMTASNGHSIVILTVTLSSNMKERIERSKRRRAWKNLKYFCKVIMQTGSNKPISSVC